ncbi:MAG: large subunit ribosomal protein L24e [Candidatus Nitrosomirales archaeon]|jgi:large subunit ribosomal protein L24e|nr:50S ribosomal protein L24e [Nitrososphaerales archaeon]
MSITAKNCSFCGNKVKLGTGTMLVKNDGSILYFCSNKCRHNMLKLRRDPRKFKWTSKYVKGGIKAGK